MPLGMASAGDTSVIRRITGRDEVRQHLAELGFVVGEQVTVVRWRSRSRRRAKSLI